MELIVFGCAVRVACGKIAQTTAEADNLRVLKSLEVNDISCQQQISVKCFHGCIDTKKTVSLTIKAD